MTGTRVAGVVVIALGGFMVLGGVLMLAETFTELLSGNAALAIGQILGGIGVAFVGALLYRGQLTQRRGLDE